MKSGTPDITGDNFGFQEGQSFAREVNNRLYQTFLECKRYRNLYQLADQRGLGNIGILEGNYMKGDGIKTLNGYIFYTSKLIEALRDFLNNPNKETLDKLAKPCAAISPMFKELDDVIY
jgi:hypothetical protein